MQFDSSSAFRLIALLALTSGCGSPAAPVDDASPTDDTASQDDATTTDDTAVGPVDGAPQVACSSGTFWTHGTSGSSSMEPGLACITCHTTMRRAPTLSIGGTVYPTAHEQDTCNGARGAMVEITDANGQVITLTTNSAGNFYSQSNVAFPIHARVLANGMVNTMISAQTTGDCNSCHTQAGTMAAPGRIMAP